MANVYYNEFDPFAAAWLKELMRKGLIPEGDIDTRSITEVTADDVKGYTQCHWFAGIGGWSYALQLAGIPPTRPLWTGSCPCQPFSSAGKRKGKEDERHLWPHWYRLIRECRPSIVFGEQVEGALAYGWLDEVFNDLENEGYACGAAVLPACSVGAPHRRYRLWFVAHSGLQRPKIDEEQTTRVKQSSQGGSVADGEQQRSQGRLCRGKNSEGENQYGHFGCGSASSLRWIECPDGKARPVKPGICLLANGFPNRVGALRGLGNAIVPQVAAEFISSVMGISNGK